MRVGELRVRDRELALEIGPPGLLEPPVGFGVDARDEEARDRDHAAGVAAGGDQPLEPAEVRLDDLRVALEREDQRDVDRAALGDAVLDRAEARLGAGDLHVEVLPLDLARGSASPAGTTRRGRTQASGRPRARRSRRRRPCAPRRARGGRTRRGCPPARGRRTARPGRRSSAAAARSCSSYQSPSASAFWKIVGLEVTPTTASSSIRRASSPVSSISRESESIQALTPCSLSSCNLERFMSTSCALQPSTSFSSSSTFSNRAR